MVSRVWQTAEKEYSLQKRIHTFNYNSLIIPYNYYLFMIYATLYHTSNYYLFVTCAILRHTTSHVLHYVILHRSIILLSNLQQVFINVFIEWIPLKHDI
jgi:hypothetical protein